MLGALIQTNTAFAHNLQCSLTELWIVCLPKFTFHI